jgi:regulator of sirC expression with transglutaminase-like and TPR domain
MNEFPKEINALLHLIDDPDDLVFETVSARLVEYGDCVVSILDEYIETTDEEISKKRVQQIIDQISINTLKESILKWRNDEENSFLEISIIISQLISKSFNRNLLLFELEKIRKSIWLELNDYLTPLEVINIFNKVIFEHFKFSSIENDKNKEYHYSLIELIELKEGNSFPLASIYLIMSEMLGLGIFPAAIHKQNLLCYFEENIRMIETETGDILFYFDPSNGQVYTHNDIENYYKKIGYHTSAESITITEKTSFSRKWLTEYAKSLEKGCWKQQQLISIADELF